MKCKASARDNLKEFTRSVEADSVNVAGPKIGERPKVLALLSGVSFSLRSRITRAA